MLNVCGRLVSPEVEKFESNSTRKGHHKVTRQVYDYSGRRLQTLRCLFSLNHWATATVTDRWKATTDKTWEWQRAHGCGRKEGIGLDGGQRPTSDITKATECCVWEGWGEKDRMGSGGNERIRGLAMNFTGSKKKKKRIWWKPLWIENLILVWQPVCIFLKLQTTTVI